MALAEPLARQRSPVLSRGQAVRWAALALIAPPVQPATRLPTAVEALAQEAHVSNRTLERIFKENVGIPPKEFLRIVRFQEVLKRLRQTDVSEESLLRVAFGLGYYDHAHLTNEFKKYAGILPS